jgi:hypothetical protein
MHKLIAALLACSLITSAWANDPRTTGTAPETLESAAAMALAKLGPSQRSIVRGTAKDSLMTLMAEWGDDLECWKQKTARHYLQARLHARRSHPDGDGSGLGGAAEVK